MKVLYDSQAFDMQTHGGVSRCFAELYSHLPQDIEASLSVMESANVYLKTLGSKPDGELYHNFLWKKDTAIKKMLDLYHYALAFVYPSSYEGFGLPILEAYKAECPVLLNHASCFPEIAEDAAVYFHMDEKRTDFEEQFETFYYLDGIEKKKLIEKQNERLKHFSWKKSALELANIYKHIN